MSEQWHIYRYSEPGDGSEAPYEESYICLCEDGKHCEYMERAIDVCIDDYAEKLDIMEQIVSLHNAQGNADE